MNYENAIEESLNKKWVVGTCIQGDTCWCRIIKCDPPLMYVEFNGSDEEEYLVVRPGELCKTTVDHIVKIHNESLK
jgi:hypothetical protein